MQNIKELLMESNKTTLAPSGLGRFGIKLD